MRLGGIPLIYRHEEPNRTLQLRHDIVDKHKFNTMYSDTGHVPSVIVQGMII